MAGERREEEGKGHLHHHPHPPLHAGRVQQLRATINRLLMLAHSAALLSMLYYRASRLPLHSPSRSPAAAAAWALMLAAELLGAFLWAMSQAFRWRPYSREAFPDRLPGDELLPPLDVFVCTADPEKEPPVGVMNTVVSAMCLDYPTDKLSVYLSDDGGSPLTLFAVREAYSFAAVWLPFCKKHELPVRCPEAYFSAKCGGSRRDPRQQESQEFVQEKDKVQLLYEEFKQGVNRAALEGSPPARRRGEDGYPAGVVVLQDQEGNTSVRESTLPRLVYVSREKRRNIPHHFKAGALNALLRVSSIISNAPHILVLDCDMYPNDPMSARHAMCFHLDPGTSPSLAFVQFPQQFHNIPKNDIYCAELREVFRVQWNGCDGLRGPPLSGTGFYIRREALCGATPAGRALGQELQPRDRFQLKRRFGQSDELVSSLLRGQQGSMTSQSPPPSRILREATLLASCSYEEGTQWGAQIGFTYGCLLEDFSTGYRLHCRGWKSAYLYPPVPAFLGTAPTRVHETLVQSKRWSQGLLEVAFSRFCPLTYGMLSRRNSVLQCLCYASLAFKPFESLVMICYATIPQLCLLKGIPLFPQATDHWFLVFILVYASSVCQHVRENISNGGSLRTWWNETRFQIIKLLGATIFATVDTILKSVGMKEVSFDLTSKVTDEEQTQHYENGIYDFRGSAFMLLPLATVVLINLAALIGGVTGIVQHSNYNEMLGQLFLSFYVALITYPVFEAMTIRNDKGRLPTSITLWSALLTMVLLALLH